jgi:hypothetical protein
MTNRRFRKQQVLGSNPSVGSTSPFRAREEQLSGVSAVFAADEALLTGEDLLTGRNSISTWASVQARTDHGAAPSPSSPLEDLLSVK